jgi:hypothetical protein
MRGRWLLLARVVWVTVALLTVSVFVLSIPSEFARLRSPCTDTVSCGWLIRLTAENARELSNLGLSVDFFASYFISLEAAFTAWKGYSPKSIFGIVHRPSPTRSETTATLLP